MAVRNLAYLFKRGIYSLRASGWRATYLKTLTYLHRHRRPLISSPRAAMDCAELVAQRFHFAAPIERLDVPSDKRRLTIVTSDAIRRGAIFGGAATALILASKAARTANATLRIVTVNAASDPNAYRELLSSIDSPPPPSTEFVSVFPGSGDTLPHQIHDRYLTTSWWTTAALGRFADARIFALTQDDERIFYPHGDDFVRCENILRQSSALSIYNTSLLFEHLSTQKIAQASSLSFEPAFPSDLFYWDETCHSAGKQPTLLFYARPNHPRNLFYLGLDTLATAVADPLFRDWKVVIVGSEVPHLQLPVADLTIATNLDWKDYAATVRAADVGLSLMLSPHPSYPPLDLAACGAVVVTNQFGSKHSLSRYSENIICVEPTRNALVGALLQAAVASKDTDRRKLNLLASNISRSWDASLAPAVDAIISGW